MKITSDDIIVYYKLMEAYNPMSNAIGITGTKLRFNHIVGMYLKTVSKQNRKVIANEEKTVYKIYDKDDIERVFVYITSTDDLKNRKFRKFL